MNSQPMQHSGDNTYGESQPFPPMNSNNISSPTQGLGDLQLMATVDPSVSQNVAMPPVVTSSQLSQSQPSNYPTSNDETIVSKILKNSAHPMACIFHCLFKIIAIFLYFFRNWIPMPHDQRYIFVTISCIVLFAIDFWVVKNVTGRLLVGLRWWSQPVGEDATEYKWIFESGNSEKAANAFDSYVFWSVVYSTPVIWSFLFLFVMLNFQWWITVWFGIILSGANTYCYYQCSKDQKSKLERMMSRGAEMGAMSILRGSNVFGGMSSFASRVAGFSASAGNGQYDNVNVQQQQQQQQQFNQQPQQFNQQPQQFNQQPQQFNQQPQQFNQQPQQFNQQPQQFNQQPQQYNQQQQNSSTVTMV